MKLLSELRNGEKGKVLKIRGKGNFHRRLLEVGVVLGATVEVTGILLPGADVRVKVNGYDRSLLEEEANGVYVEVTQAPTGA